VLSWRMLRLPNAITLMRIVLVPVFVIAFALPGDSARLIAFAIFCIAGLSDALDGLAARKLNAGSDFGRMLQIACAQSTSVEVRSTVDDASN
jgi:phosphatidylglycerophosphate synthase